MESWLRPHSRGTVLLLYIQPGARETAIIGLHGERLKIKIGAPPVDGEANEALIKFLAEVLGVAKRKVSFVRGESSRQKDLLVELSSEEVLVRLEGRLKLGDEGADS